jgi:hypothetical protein
MAKRQKYIEGSFVDIKLGNGKKVIGRLFPNFQILVYDYLLNEDEVIDNFTVLDSRNVITGNGIYKDIITKGLFPVIGFKPLTDKDFDKYPVLFKQEIGNYKECRHIFINRDSTLVNPKDCVGLEAAATWEASGLIKLIEDNYAKRKNPHTEMDKVILDDNDIRVKTPFYRWSIEKQKIVAFDPVTQVDKD